MIDTANNLYNMLYAMPDSLYKQSAFNLNGISLKELTGLNITVVGDGNLVRFFRDYSTPEKCLLDNNKVTYKQAKHNTICIEFKIPTYEKHHPKKLEATSFNMFCVFEYTERGGYDTTEINWISFKEKFNECLLKICRHCI